MYFPTISLIQSNVTTLERLLPLSCDNIIKYRAVTLQKGCKHHGGNLHILETIIIQSNMTALSHKDFISWNLFIILFWMPHSDTNVHFRIPRHLVSFLISEHLTGGQRYTSVLLYIHSGYSSHVNTITESLLWFYLVLKNNYSFLMLTQSTGHCTIHCYTDNQKRALNWVN